MGKKECIGIITNLNSSKNKKGRFSKNVLQPLLGEWGEVIDTASLAEMRNAVSYFIEKEISYLGINGGDGTIQKVITEWIRQKRDEDLPNIIPLTGGSTNAMVRFLSARAYNPATIVKRFMKKFMKNEVDLIEIALLKVEGDQLEHPQYGITFANGTILRFIERYLQYGKPGIRWVLKEIMQTIGGIAMNVKEYRELIEPIRAKVIIDGIPFPSETVKAAVATSISEPFPTLTPFRKVSKNRMEFYYIVSDLDIFTALRNAHNLLWGFDLVRYEFSGYHWMGAGKKMTIETDEGFIIDGELFHPEEWSKITVTSGIKVNFVYP